VTSTTVTGLSDGERLEILRHLDQFRHWHSLDEKRYCLVCGKIITGRQIQVADGPRGNGPLHLNCPTEGCNSIPMDWVLPTSEMLAKLESSAVEKSETSTILPCSVTETGKTADADKGPEHFVSRLRNFAFHLRRHP
jgi:hypothetical protein